MKSTILNQSSQKSKIQQMQDFYSWLLKCRNVHLHDNNQVMNACERVTQRQNFFICTSKTLNVL